MKRKSTLSRVRNAHYQSERVVPSAYPAFFMQFSENESSYTMGQDPLSWELSPPIVPIWMLPRTEQLRSCICPLPFPLPLHRSWWGHPTTARECRLSKDLADPGFGTAQGQQPLLPSYPSPLTAAPPSPPRLWTFASRQQDSRLSGFSQSSPRRVEARWQHQTDLRRIHGQPRSSGGYLVPAWALI